MSNALAVVPRQNLRTQPLVAPARSGPGSRSGPTYRRALRRSYKDGGYIPKTGQYRLHKGEMVLNAEQVRAMFPQLGPAPKGRKGYRAGSLPGVIDINRGMRAPGRANPYGAQNTRAGNWLTGQPDAPAAPQFDAGAGAGTGGGTGAGSVGSAGNQNLTGDFGAMSEFGQGLMDPDSALSGRFNESLRGQIGQQAGAQKRLAALESSQSGMGGGASPELMGMQRDIDVAGQAAGGQAAANFALQAPRLGVQALGSTFGPQVGMEGIAASERTAASGRGLSRDLQQQQLAYQRAQREAAMRQQMGSQRSQEAMQLQLAQLGLMGSLY